MIIAYTGLPGSGKTYSLAKDCHNEQIKRHRDIYANFALKGAHYFSDIRQILNVEQGIIAIDEMNTLCPASKWQQLPISYVNLWTQSRKNGIDLWFTTQNFRRVVSSIRDVTNYVWRFNWVFSPNFIHKWHTAKLYEAYDAEREREKARPLKKYRFYENKKIYSIYNTKFRIKPPEHLSINELSELDPNSLPVFDETLKLENILSYEPINDRITDDARESYDGQISDSPNVAYSPE